MMCKSNYDLTKYGKRIKNVCKSHELFMYVFKKYYPKEEDDNIWIIDGIDSLCNETLDENMFYTSEVYFLLNNICDICEWIILWYGNEYGDLDIVYTKSEFIRYIQRCIEKPGCELYVRLCRDKK